MQALGLIWTALHLAMSHWSGTFGPRHLVYEPGVLLIIVGFLVTLVCIPVAHDVVRASPEDVEIPVYEPESALTGRAQPGLTLKAEGGRLARYSSGRTHPPKDRDP
jgi:hypothetical protein